MVEWGGIRLAAEEEIGAMKLDVVARGGRKKDFWDLAEIFETYPLLYLLNVYQEKYPYNEVSEVIKRLTDFSIAEEVPDPICLKARTWGSVKQRIREEAQKV